MTDSLLALLPSYGGYLLALVTLLVIALTILLLLRSPRARAWLQKLGSTVRSAFYFYSVPNKLKILFGFYQV